MKKRRFFLFVSTVCTFGLLMLGAVDGSFAATFNVNSTADAVDVNIGDGICQTATVGQCTLRAAIQEANAAPAIADTVNLPAGIYILTLIGANEDAAATGDLDIVGTLAINGAGQATTIIDGNNSDRVFQTLTNGTAATISGITIRNGNSGAGPGGGISVSAGTSLTLNNTIVTNCATGAAAEGGGIENSGTLTMNTVSITNNTSPGGGINNGIAGTITLTNGTLSGNSDRAINNSGSITLTNVTISGNTTGGNGAGLDNAGTATLHNVTINGNTSAVLLNIGGIRNNGTVTLSNTVISNNTPLNCGGVNLLTSQGGNLSSDATCALAGIGDVNNTDPLLGPLANNGGRLLTHALLAGSPAIDTGGNPTCPATDERGVSRPKDGNGDTIAVCDIGAFEFCSAAFVDVPPGAFAEGFISTLACRGITGGCGGGIFCPNDSVTRAQMAVFIETALGVAATPPCSGTVFADVNGAVMSPAFCGFIEKLAADGITGGCGGGIFCPDNPVTRGQMAVFIEAALGMKTPPPCAGTNFTDVTAATVGTAFCGFIEDFAARGISAGCGAGLFCPNDPVTRAQMAVFLNVAF